MALFTHEKQRSPAENLYTVTGVNLDCKYGDESPKNDELVN